MRSLYEELEPTEAYALFLAAAGRHDREAACEVVGAVPTVSYWQDRSLLMEIEAGFRAMAEVVDRELRPAIAQLAVFRAARASAELHAEVAADLASKMYLEGVRAGSGEPPTSDHETRAVAIGRAISDEEAPYVARWAHESQSVSQGAADVLHAFDAVCQTVGVDAALVAEAHGLGMRGDLDKLRSMTPSDVGSALWFGFLVQIWLDRTSRLYGPAAGKSKLARRAEPASNSPLRPPGKSA